METRPVQDRLYTDLKQGGVLFMPVSGVYDDRDYGWMAMEIGLSTAIYLAKRHRLSMVYCRSKDGGSISIQYWKSHYDKWYWLQEEKERTVISSKDLFTSISEIFEFTIPRDFVSVENHVKSLVLSRMNDAEAITRHKRSLRGGFDAYICTKMLYGNHNELKV